MSLRPDRWRMCEHGLLIASHSSDVLTLGRSPSLAPFGAFPLVFNHLIRTPAAPAIPSCRSCLNSLPRPPCPPPHTLTHAHHSSQQAWNAGRFDCLPTQLVGVPSRTPRNALCLGFSVPLDLHPLSEPANTSGSEAQRRRTFIFPPQPHRGHREAVFSLLFLWGSAHSFHSQSDLLPLSRRHLWPSTTLFSHLAASLFADTHTLFFGFFGGHPRPIRHQDAETLDTEPSLFVAHTAKTDQVAKASGGKDKTSQSLLCFASRCSTRIKAKETPEVTPAQDTCRSASHSEGESITTPLAPPRHETSRLGRRGTPSARRLPNHNVGTRRRRIETNSHRTSQARHRVSSIHKDHPCPTLRAP